VHLGRPARRGRNRQAGGPPIRPSCSRRPASFLGALGIEQAHVAGLSLGAATGCGFAAKYPERVKSLSLSQLLGRRSDPSSDRGAGWQTMAKGLGSVTEM